MPRSEADFNRDLAVQARLTTLDERVEQLRNDLARVERNAAETDRDARENRTKLELLAQRFEDSKKGLDEASGRRWSLVPALVGTTLGFLLSQLATLLLRR